MHQRADRRVAAVVYRGRGAQRRPDLVENHPGNSFKFHDDRQRAVAGDDRFAFCVMRGDDPVDWAEETWQNLLD